MKKCKICLTEKELSLFGSSKSRKGTTVYKPICNSCRTEKARNKRTERLVTICECCGTSWRKTEGRKQKNLCQDCYPWYRLAYNLTASCEYRAKKKQLPFELDVDWVYKQLLTKKCSKTGIELSLSNNGNSYATRKPTTPSIDKIEPLKGYTKENVQIVCWWYNLSKSVFTDEEVFQLCKAVIKHNQNS